MKKVIFVLLIALIAITTPRSEIINKIVARVNDQIITDFDVQLIILFDRRGTLEYGEVLNKLVEDQLVIASAKDREYEISDQEIDYNIDQSIANQRSQYPSDDAFKEALKREGLTLSALKENYRKQIKNQYLKEMIIEDKIRKKISISTDEVEEYYEENREKFKSAPLRYDISSIYISAVDIKAMQDIYRKIRKTGKVPKAVEVKEFKKLYIEYLTEDQKKILIGKKSGYTDSLLSEKGLSFYKIVKYDAETPSVKYYLIPSTTTKSSMKAALNSARGIQSEITKGASFNEYKSKEDPDQDNYFTDPQLTVDNLNTLGIEKTVISLKPGDLHSLQGRLGAYVIRLNDILESEYSDIGTVYTRIYNEKYEEKFSVLLKDLIAEARAENFIQVYK
ncbi:SurA N-terminal domain-containing protein [bacterium]|nr:SurA N-terminal domain-containing protein [bacterium]